MHDLVANGACNTQGTVCEITYTLCTASITYQDDAERPINYRLKEHIRAASNPTSYPNNTMGQHSALRRTASLIHCITVSMLDI